MKTAVEWLLFELSKNGLLPDGISSDIHNQAKEMEKEQMIDFADKYDAYVVQGGTLTAERYYNETFKTE
jgi:phage gp29-like protein